MYTRTPFHRHEHLTKYFLFAIISVKLDVSHVRSEMTVGCGTVK